MRSSKLLHFTENIERKQQTKIQIASDRNTINILKLNYENFSLICTPFSRTFGPRHSVIKQYNLRINHFLLKSACAKKIYIIVQTSR